MENILSMLVLHLLPHLPDKLIQAPHLHHRQSPLLPPSCPLLPPFSLGVPPLPQFSFLGPLLFFEDGG